MQQYTVNISSEELVKSLLDKEIEKIKKQDKEQYLEKDKKTNHTPRKEKKQDDSKTDKNSDKDDTPIDRYTIPKEILDKNGIDEESLKKHLMKRLTNY